MPKYGYREIYKIADLGSRCSRGCWLRARFQMSASKHPELSERETDRRSASTPGWLRNSYETTVNQPWDTTISSPITYVNGVPEFITTHEKYEFGSIFASARSGDLDEFDVAVAALALQYEQYSIDHPVKALLAKVAVKSRVPRAFARAMAAMRSE